MATLGRWIFGASLVALAACSSTVVQDSSDTDSGAGTRRPGDDGGPVLDDEGGVIGPDGSLPGADGGRSDTGASGDGGDGGPQGATQLKAGDVSIQAVTSDDFVVYSLTSGATTSLEVMPLTGGQSTVLAATFDPQADYAFADGKVVAFWTGVDAQTGVGKLGIWSSASGLKNVGPGSLAGMLYASKDGSRILYSTAATATTTTLSLGNPALSPASTSLLTSVNIATCQPDIGWVDNRLFLATCANAATTATVRTVAPTAATSVTVATTQSPYFSADSAGDKVLVKTAAGSLSMRTVPVTVSTTIDTGVATAILTSDGMNVVYRTSALALKRATAGATPAPTTLVGSGVRGLLAISDDFSSVLTYSNAPDTTNPNVARIDIRLASATTAGALTPLLAASTGKPVGFTSNSAYAVYLTDLPATGPALGTLKATGVAAGSTEKQIAQNTIVARLVPGATSAKVVYVVSNGSGSTATFDASEIDLAGGGSPTALAADITGLELTATKFLYTQDQKGLYVTGL